MNPQDRLVAYRYARALFETARAAKDEEKVRQEILKLGETFRARPELALALRHPRLPAAEKKAIALGKAGNLSPVMDRFLSLLLAKKRAGLLPFIADLFEELWEKTQNILTLDIKTAQALSPSQVEKLQEKFAKQRGAPVRVRAASDESLIGGLVVRAGDKVWDLSLRGRLQRLRGELLRASQI